MKKLKKLLCLALAVLMVCAMLSGCEKLSDAEQFFKYISDMSELKESKYSEAVSISLTEAALNELGDGDVSLSAITGGGGLDVSFALDGSTSYSKKQAAVDMKASIKLNGADMTVDLTDIIIDGSSMYMNIGKLMKLAAAFIGQDMADVITADYLVMDLQEESGMDIWAETEDGGMIVPAGLEEAAGRVESLVGQIEERVKSADPALVTENAGAYTLTLDRAAIIEFSTVILTDAHAYADVYYDALRAMLEANSGSEGMDSALGMFGDRDEDIAAVKTEIDSLLGSMKEMPEMTATASVKFDEKAKSYAFTMGVTVPDMADISVDAKLESAEVEAITPPSDAMTMDELNALTEALSGISGADGPAPVEEFGASLELNAVIGTHNPSILNPELSGFTALVPVTLTRGGAEYVLPCVADETMVADEGMIYAQNDDASVYYEYYDLGDYTPEQLIRENAAYSKTLFDTYPDKYDDVAFSDLWLSADGSVALLTTSCTVEGHGRQYELAGAQAVDDGAGAVYFSVSFTAADGGGATAGAAEFFELLGTEPSDIMM